LKLIREDILKSSLYCGFAIAGLTCFVLQFEQRSRFVLLINFSAKIPAIAKPQNVIGQYIFKKQDNK